MSQFSIFLQKDSHAYFKRVLSDLTQILEQPPILFDTNVEIPIGSFPRIEFSWEDKKLNGCFLISPNQILENHKEINLPWEENQYSKISLFLFMQFSKSRISTAQEKILLEVQKERLHFFENVYEESLDLMIQIKPQTKQILGVNRRTASRLGFDKADLIGKDFSLIVKKSDNIEEAIADDTIISGNELICKDGEMIPVETSFRMFTLFGEVAIWVTFRDISEKKKVQDEVKNQKIFYEFILDNIDSDISVLNEEYKYEYANPSMLANSDLSVWLLNKDDSEFAEKLELPDDFVRQRQYYLERAFEEGRIMQFEELISNKDIGNRYLLRKYIPLESEGRKKIISYGIDITDRKLAEDRISYLAYYDSLTGLSNRTLFIEHCNQALRSLLDESKQIAIFFFDIDNFKFINDTLGHSKGDMLLQMVAARLKRIIDEADTLARFGGDEFAILKIGLNGQEPLSSFASKLLDTMNQPFNISGRDIFTSTSIGISIAPNDGNTSASLLKCADLAMYKAKELGRNNFKYFTEELNQKSEKRLYLENNLRKAILNRELQLFFQPQIRLSDEKVSGAEALIRWNHPERGWVPPSDFIPVAEDAGMIQKIGDWVLEEACRWKAEWTKKIQDTFVISVNVSGKQLSKVNWALKVENTIRQYNIDPKEIELELTESSIMENPERSIEAFRYLSKIGVKVSIDDFGTGYSSLSYLKKIDADVLKIDRSFVIDLETNKDDRAICLAIIKMAMSLGMEVIAEGVENMAQKEILKEMGCDIVQGYFYSKPMPADDFLQFLLDRNS